MIAGPGERVLDAGCGSGAAALCLAARIPGCTITGVERDPEAAAWARRNVAANGMEERVAIVEQDIAAFAAAAAGRFDQILINPPFHERGRHTRSPSRGRAVAHGEDEFDLAGWVSAAAKALKPGGTLTLIHRADRIADILAALQGQFGAVSICPLWPRAATAAKRIVVGAVKGRRTPARLLSGLVLHEADGRYTAAAEAILRDATPLDLAMGSN